MTKVDKIEQEIRRLPLEELTALRKWFREFDAEAWDREIEEDIKAGRLDSLAEEAMETHRKGGSSRL
jgi:hypothetical protein